MLTTLMLSAAALLSQAQAGEWSDQDIDPKVITDVTAYTLGKNRWHLGLYEQSYGLLDNVQVGTSAPLYALGIFNLGAKITAIQTKRVDASFNVRHYAMNLPDIPNGKATLTPLSWTASWRAHRRFSLHIGQGWWLANVSGGVDTATIADAIETMTGASINDDLVGVLGSSGGAYADVDMTLFEAHIAADYRLNRRDSIVLTVSNFSWLRGLAVADIESEANDGTEVALGANARFSIPLEESVPTMTTLSWQFSYERWHVRLGLPIGSGDMKLFAIPRALQVYYVPGPKQK